MKWYGIVYLILLKSLFSNSLVIKKIDIQNYPIEYYSYGKKNPVFLLVHGLGVNKNSFLRLAETIAIDYQYKILLPDIPGQGNTPKIQEKNYSIEEMADFLYKFLQALKIKQVVIIGNSMGGHIATVFTLKYPRMVSYLILISPSGIDNGKEKPYLPIPLENLQDTDKIKSLEWNNKIREDIRNNPYYIVNPYLNKIKHPTILFWGKDDEIISYSNSAIWATEIPNVKFYVLKGGHLLQNEKPKEIFRIIQKEIGLR